jgi:chromosome segregation ATPase
MLGLIRALPILLLIGGLAYGAHSWIVNRLENQITVQQRQIDELNQHNVALQSAAEQNESTIRNLEAKAQQQVQQITALTNSAAEWENQAKEYMSIFANHNFTRLARLKPDTIERQANDATKAVFDSVEADSRETEELNNEPQDN